MSRLLVDGKTPRDPGAEQFRMEGWIDTAPFEVLVGLRLLEAKEGRAVLQLPFAVMLSQGGGVMHGGALTTLADTAVALAIKTLLPEGTIFATTEMTMRFLAPMRQGTVTARASVEGPEGRSFRGRVSMTDDEGVEVAACEAVFRVARGQGVEG